VLDKVRGKGVGENSVEKVLDKLRGKGVGKNDMEKVLVKMCCKRCWTISVGEWGWTNSWSKGVGGIQ
jgi:hypothetical protein